MPASRNDLSFSRAVEVLTYDPASGAFRVNVGPRKGKLLRGSPNAAGYLRITVDGRLYYAHRLAWLCMTGAWPADQVDHRDLDKANNRWGNLRPATASTNGFNIAVHTHNRSGLKGVYLNKITGRFYAQITAGKETRHLGHFATSQEASEAWERAARVYHGEYARAA